MRNRPASYSSAINNTPQKNESYDSKFSAFANMSTKFFSNMLDSKDTCNICGCSFKLISTNKYHCSSCSMAVCKEHSSEIIGETIERICDSCRDDKIREETEFKNQGLKEKLFEDIRAMQDDRGAKTREISKIGLKIRKTEKEYNENMANFKQKEEEELANLEKQKEITCAIEEEYIRLKTQLEVAQISEGKAEIKLKYIEEALQSIKVEVNALESENDDQNLIFEELKKTAQLRVPLQMVKNNLCKFCLMKVNLTHGLIFKGILPATEERKTPQKFEISRPEPIRRCNCNCEIH